MKEQNFYNFLIINHNNKEGSYIPLYYYDCIHYQKKKKKFL